jgi:hypothetical protein
MKKWILQGCGSGFFIEVRYNSENESIGEEELRTGVRGKYS